MATGTTLTVLLDDLREELGTSNSPSIGQAERAILVRALNRAQKFYFNDFNWPHLRVRSDVLSVAGQRYYDLPNDISLDHVEKIDVKWGESWLPVERGIPNELYTAVDSDDDIRLDPVQRWDVIDVGTGAQIEFWPIPSTNNIIIRFEGFKEPPKLINGSDQALLDDDLIVLTAAAKLLARNGAEDAEEAANAARRRYEVLKTRGVSRRLNNPSFARKQEHTRQRPRNIVAVDKEN